MHRGFAVFVAETSSGQKAALTANYGSSSNWVTTTENEYLRQNGFSGVGAWSNVDLILYSAKPLIYNTIASPLVSYRSQHIKKFTNSEYPAGSYSWQGYYRGIVMVFDLEFDTYVDSSIKGIAKYANDKNLLGYFTDNELLYIDKALFKRIVKLFFHTIYLCSPKSSNLNISLGTPKSQSIFSTALAIGPGPHM